MDRGLIPRTIWKISFLNLFITYFTLTFSMHWLLYCKKISELTNCENKSVDLYNDFRNLFVKSTQDVDIWMEIPIQHDLYIWANYSVSSYLNFIPICWNVSIWLKYDFMHIFMHHLSLYFETTAQIQEVEFGGKYRYMRAHTDIWGQIRIFEGQYGYLPRIYPEGK